MKAKLKASSNFVKNENVNSISVDIASQDGLVSEQLELLNSQFEARQRLIKGNLNLVYQIVKKMGYMKSSDIDEDDLVGYGIIGLVEAAQKYEESKGRSFQAFAGLRIRGAILDQLRSSDSLTRSSRKKVKTLSSSIQELERELGSVPTNAQIAERMNVSLEELCEIQKEASVITLSLNTTLSDESEETWLDQVSDSKPTPYENCENNNLKENLIKAIGELPERERLVVGLYHYRNFTMRQIASILKVSESRACQIHNRGISLLKSKLEKFVAV
ncbi:MAG: FliA/WhiG family RNA polymerase sigma factor [Candidatus Caenarcaniphilales bacterium]|nr:FliA/WhiG family RNA polymerase sigma factor [Candidatus Caenarcaniphilales bacterium]